LSNAVDNSRNTAEPAIVSALSERQADLLSRLDRAAVPISMARKYAAQELNLEAIRDVLEEEAILTQPFSPNDISPDYERLQRQLVWLVLRMDMKVLEDLRSGTLLGFGVRLPLRPSSASTPIPPGLWYLMSFNMDDCTAAGPQWSYRDVRVINVRSMGAPERREIDRGLAILAAKLEADERAMAAPRPTEQTACAPSSSPGKEVEVDHVEESGCRPTTETEDSTSDTNINLAIPEDRGDSDVPAAQEDVGESPHNETVRGASYGPWSVMPQIEEELRRRAAAKQCKKTWALESVYLEHWAGKKFKRDEATKIGDPPSLKWIREKLGKLYYELNPETPRPPRLRQKTETPANPPTRS
jgi:hypothetical protein